MTKKPSDYLCPIMSCRGAVTKYRDKNGTEQPDESTIYCQGADCVAYEEVKDVLASAAFYQMVKLRHGWHCTATNSCWRELPEVEG